MDNQGWDVIYAIRSDAVSKTMQANMKGMITTFSYTADGYKLEGEFGPWSIGNLGSTTNIVLDMPVKLGTFERIENGKVTDKQDLSETCLSVEFKLDFLSGSDNVKSLQMVAHQETGDTDPNSTVNVALVDNTGKVPPTPANQNLIDQLKKAYHAVMWENRSILDYVFATVSLVGPSEASWMAPTDFRYYFWDSKPAGYLLILTTLAGNTHAPNLPLDPDPDLLSANTGHDAHVSISSQMFMRHMLQPAMGSDFAVKGTNQIYLTKEKSFHSTWAFGSFDSKVPTVTTILSNDTLSTTYSGHVDFGCCSHGSFSGSVTNKFKSSGSSISFPVTSSNYTHDDPDICFGDGFLIGFTLGAYYGVLEGQLGSIKDAVSSGMSATMNVPTVSAIQWTNNSALNIISVELRNSLVMSGDF